MHLTDFRFVLEFDNGNRLGAFTECVLPTIQWETQKIVEGGVNHFVHQLPTHRQEATITLKRGIGLGQELFSWYAPALVADGQLIKKNVTIHLLAGKRNGINSDYPSAISWTVTQAFPIKWTGPSLKAEGNAIAIESLELACNEISVVATTIPATSANWNVTKQQQGKRGKRSNSGRK